MPPVAARTPAAGEDPRLKRLEAQIDALTRQLETLGRDRGEATTRRLSRNERRREDLRAVERCGGGGRCRRRCRLSRFCLLSAEPARGKRRSEAARLCAAVPAGIARVGLFVDADDEMIAAVLAAAPLDILQFHGSETRSGSPRRGRDSVVE